MKALLVAPQPMYEDRGTPIALRQVLEALAELGHEVDLLTFPVGRTLDLPGVSWHRAPNPLRIRRVPVGFSLRKVALDAGLVRELARHLARHRYDWVHAVEEAAFPAALLARRHGVPLLYDMQSSLPDQLRKTLPFRLPGIPRALRRAERWLLRNADLVVASTGLRAHVQSVAPDTVCREWSFPSVAPFIDLAETDAVRRELRLGPDEPVVFYSGTFEAYQGLPMLVDAAALVLSVRPRCRFVLMGGDPRGAGEIERRAEERGIADRITLVARQPRERAWNYLALADIAVSPRCFGDNLPLKVIDYLALGKPIVATDIPAHTSALDTNCAELVPVGAEGLAAGILRLLENPRRSAQVARGAARRAQTQFGGDRFLELVAETIEILTAAPGPAATSPVEGLKYA